MTVGPTLLDSIGVSCYKVYEGLIGKKLVFPLHRLLSLCKLANQFSRRFTVGTKQYFCLMVFSFFGCLVIFYLFVHLVFYLFGPLDLV